MIIKEGAPLDEETQQLIRENVPPKDWMPIAIELNVSNSTVRNILYGNQPINSPRHKAIIKRFIKEANQQAREHLISYKNQIDKLNTIQIA